MPAPIPHETMWDMKARNAGDPVVTIFKDGRWTLEGERDAHLSAALDEDFLVYISVKDICEATGAV